MEIGRLLRKDAVGAWHVAETDDAPATVRLLREAHVGNDAARLLFVEEIRRIRTLDHEALVRVHAADADAARPWMRTESIDVPTLAEVVAREGPLGDAEARALAGRMLQACGYLEGRRQVHAYPIPSRILRTADGWKLATFRDIRAWDELKTLKGKKHPDAAFAPPERGKAAPDAYTPHPHVAWHVGAVLRFAVGGGPPCTAAGTPAPLPSDLGAEVRASIERLTTARPALRPQGVPGVLRALDGAVPPTGGHGPATGAAPRPAAPVPKRRRRRR